MSKKSTQKGAVVLLPAPAGGVLSGEPKLINGLFGVAQTDGNEDDMVPFAVEGGHILPLDDTKSTDFGARLYWDNSAGEVTTDSSANKEIGCALSAEQVGAVEVEVLLGIRVGA